MHYIILLNIKTTQNLANKKQYPNQEGEMMDEDAIVNPINDAERVSVYGTHNDEKKTSEDDDSANLTVSEFNQLFKMHPA